MEITYWNDDVNNSLTELHLILYIKISWKRDSSARYPTHLFQNRIFNSCLNLNFGFIVFINKLNIYKIFFMIQVGQINLIC